jgi:starch synthase
VPLVLSVGGLADTVVDATLEDMADGRATGFCFDTFDADGFGRALRRAFALYRRPADWDAVRASAMGRPADWRNAAARYLDVYAQALA